MPIWVQAGMWGTFAGGALANGRSARYVWGGIAVAHGIAGMLGFLAAFAISRGA